MLALTLWQPWCFIVVEGIKRVENRPWAPPKAVIGQRIALHAGRTYDKAAEQAIEASPLYGRRLPAEAHIAGAIIGVARVERYVYGLGESLPGTGSAAATIEEWIPGQSGWFFGPYGWLLSDIVKLPEPVVCNGMQKLWTVKPDTAHLVRIGLEKVGVEL